MPPLFCGGEKDMFTQEEYLWGWFYYLLGATFVMGCLWVISARIPWREPRTVTRTVFAVFLYFPWFSDNQHQYLSPAWMVSAIEFLFEGANAFWRAGLPLLLAMTLVLLLSLGVTLGYRFYLARTAKSGTHRT